MGAAMSADPNREAAERRHEAAISGRTPLSIVSPSWNVSHRDRSATRAAAGLSERPVCSIADPLL
jgi:hypothetical protein